MPSCGILPKNRKRSDFHAFISKTSNVISGMVVLNGYDPQVFFKIFLLIMQLSCWIDAPGLPDCESGVLLVLATVTRHSRSLMFQVKSC